MFYYLLKYHTKNEVLYLEIKGIENLSVEEINNELKSGGKFVFFQYTFSVLVKTFKRPSKIYFIRGDEGTALKSLPFTLITLFFGWWGIPWGPIYSIGSIFRNLTGGKNVTNEVIDSMNQHAQSALNEQDQSMKEVAAGS